MSLTTQKVGETLVLYMNKMGLSIKNITFF